MHPTGPQKSDNTSLQQLWRQVCASRGTPASDPARLAGFMEELGTLERHKLESVLHLAARGREQPGELSLLSWAAACTRPALFDQLATHSLPFTSAGLFACGLALRQEGWDIQHRIAQLQSHPADVDTLRALLPAESSQAEADPQKDAAPRRPEEAAADDSYFPWSDDGLPDGEAPSREGQPMDAMGDSPAESNPSTALPLLPTRFARQQPNALSGAASAAGASDEPRLRLRLFGKSAAHTLEVTAHRRGGDFLGVHVVSIDSAHSLGAGGGYAWERKLVIQLTPKEMPGLIATLIGLTPSVRFGHHGPGRDKFIESALQNSLFI